MHQEEEMEEMTEISMLSHQEDKERSSSDDPDKASSSGSTSRHKRTITPTTLGLAYSSAYTNSPSTTNLRNSRAETPRPALDQQVEYDYMLSPAWAPSPGPSARLSSLYDGQSEFPSSATSLRSSQVGPAFCFSCRCPGLRLHSTVLFEECDDSPSDTFCT